MARRTDAEMLLDLVPNDGEAVGNKWLQNQLRWSEDKYWRIRDSLLDTGTLERGRGKGGSVRRPITVSNQPIVAAPRSTEAQLYEPLLKVLQNDWVREMRIEPSQIHFEITARQGKKPT
jgi:hypothetical protein